MKIRDISLMATGAIISIAVATAAAPLGATEPFASAPARMGGPGSSFSTTGRIKEISRQTAQIAFFPDKPFWGPPHYTVSVLAGYHSGDARFVFWPAGTLFIVKVAAAIPMTIDGQKAGFAQLRVGQTVDVQYVITSQMYMYCAARRIDARTSPSTESRRPRTRQ